MNLKLDIFGLLTFLTLFIHVSAFWRMPCMGVVARGQMDPIVSPGEMSAHLHTFKGGSGKFYFSPSISLPTSTFPNLSSKYEISCANYT